VVLRIITMKALETTSGKCQMIHLQLHTPSPLPLLEDWVEALDESTGMPYQAQ